MSNKINDALYQNNIKIVEQLVRSLFVADVSPKEFFIGLHNAFVHGKVFELAGLNCNDQTLNKMFTNLNNLVNISTQIE